MNKRQHHLEIEAQEIPSQTYTKSQANMQSCQANMQIPSQTYYIEAQETHISEGSN